MSLPQYLSSRRLHGNRSTALLRRRPVAPRGLELSPSQRSRGLTHSFGGVACVTQGRS